MATTSDTNDEIRLKRDDMTHYNPADVSLTVPKS